MTSTKSQPKLSVSILLTLVFLVISTLAAVMIYAAYLHQRDLVVRNMGRAEAERTARLVSDHLYSVMRKGWTRAEMDDVIHHVRLRLPDYEIGVIRGESVARQYGEIAGHADIRRKDPLVAEVFRDKREVFEFENGNLRYGFAVIMATECLGCHSQARPGDVNGVVTVGIPASFLNAPIESVVLPTTQMLSALILVLFIAVFGLLRWKVVRPIADFAEHVGHAMRLGDEARQIKPRANWVQEVDSLASNFNALMKEVSQSHQRLSDMSLHDGLTGLYNRRYFDTALERAINDTKAGAQAFGLLLIDLDQFKPINDKHGHAAGDAILVDVAKAIRATLRGSDMAARIGGDEFVVLALGAKHELTDLAERLRLAVASVSVRVGHSQVFAACSVGVASYPEDGATDTDIFRNADAAMYYDKRSRVAPT